MDDLPHVGPEALAAVAAFCRRSVAQELTPDEIGAAIFADDDPAVVRFDPDVGLVATGRHGDEGYIKLLAVDPARRRRGHGNLLVRQAERDLAGCAVVTVGADAPYFLFPGVPTEELWCCYLFERHHYAREETNYNVDVSLRSLPPDAGTATTPSESERGEVSDWMRRHWPNWRAEVLRAFDRGSLLVTRDDRGLAGFCAFDVNRAGTLGPIASRPDLIGTGAGASLLVSALHTLRRNGHERIEVLWVGPLVPYARVGGTIGTVFFVYRKRRPASDSGFRST